MFLCGCHVSLIFHVSHNLVLISVHLAEQILQTLQTGFSGERPSPAGGCKGTRQVECIGSSSWEGPLAIVHIQLYQLRSVSVKIATAKGAGVCCNREGCWGLQWQRLLGTS